MLYKMSNQARFIVIIMYKVYIELLWCMAINVILQLEVTAWY